MLVYLSRFPAVALVFLMSLSASGAVVINEVNPAGTEWLEIYNPANDFLDLSTWRTKDNSTNMPDDITCWTISNCNLTTNVSYFLILGRNTDISEITNQTITYFYVDDSAIGNSLTDGGDNLTFYNDNFTTSFGYNRSVFEKSWQRIPDGSDYITPCNPTPGYENNCQIQNMDDGTCDLSLKINTSSLVYDSGETISYKLIVDDLSCSNALHSYKVSYRIENLFGDYLRTPYTSTYEIKCHDTSTHRKKTDELCGIEAYLIKARITDSSCNDLNPENDRDEFLIVVKGKDPSDSDCNGNMDTFIAPVSEIPETAVSPAADTASAAIKSFYTLARNLYSGRTINLYASVENLEDFTQNLKLQLNGVTRELVISPKSSQKTSFAVTLPDSDVNYNLQLFQNNNLICERTLSLKVTNTQQNFSEEIYEIENLTGFTGAVVWTSEKISTTTIAMLLFIAMLIIFIIALLLTK